MSLPRRKTRPRTKPEPDTVRSIGHMAYVRKTYLCAAVDSGECGGRIEVHHVRLGAHAGTSQKPGDDRVVPLCSFHHTALHATGEATFQKRHGLNLERMAADLWQADSYHRAAWLRKRENV